MKPTDPAHSIGQDDPEESARHFRRGDPGAVEKVRRRIERNLAFKGFHIPIEDRKDLVQETMTQLWQAVSRPGFEPSNSFWALVDIVSSRRCIDWRRTSRQSVPLDDVRVDSGQDPLIHSLAGERQGLAYSVLNRLEEPCRELIYLHTGLEKTYGEISEILGKSEGALRVQMHRCIQKARNLVEVVESAPKTANPREGRK